MSLVVELTLSVSVPPAKDTVKQNLGAFWKDRTHKVNSLNIVGCCSNVAGQPKKEMMNVYYMFKINNLFSYIFILYFSYYLGTVDICYNSPEPPYILLSNLPDGCVYMCGYTCTHIYVLYFDRSAFGLILLYVNIILESCTFYHIPFLCNVMFSLELLIISFLFY